jgi:hypothetical protein
MSILACAIYNGWIHISKIRKLWPCLTISLAVSKVMSESRVEAMCGEGRTWGYVDDMSGGWTTGAAGRVVMGPHRQDHRCYDCNWCLRNGGRRCWSLYARPGAPSSLAASPLPRLRLAARCWAWWSRGTGGTSRGSWSMAVLAINRSCWMLDGLQTVFGSRDREKTLFKMCSVSDLFLKMSKTWRSWRNKLPLSSASNVGLSEILSWSPAIQVESSSTRYSKKFLPLLRVYVANSYNATLYLWD